MQLRKFAAIAGSALMAGMTMAGAALAQDNVGEITKLVSVSDSTVTFPTLVVGADAAPADIVGAINVGVRLAAEAGQTKTVTTGTAATGVESEEIPLNYNVSASGYLKSTVKNADVPSVLKDSSITWTNADDSDTYDFQEKVLISNHADQQIETSATKNKDFEDNPALFIKNGGLRYNFTFDENINTTKISSDYPLEIELLGQTLKITSVDANKLTATVAEEHFLYAGGEVTVEDKVVTLETVGSSSVAVSVDGGTPVVISSGSEKSVGGIKIKVGSILYLSENQESSGATLEIGSDITKSYSNNDPYIGEDKNDPTWKWDLSALLDQNAKHGIAVYYAKTLNSPDDNPPGIGEAIAFPNDYIQIAFDGVSTHTLGAYSFEFADGVDLATDGYGENTDASVIKISTTDTTDAFYLAGAAEYSDTIYLYTNATSGTTGVYVFYEDTDNNIVYSELTDYTASDNFADITYQDVTLDLEWANITASGGTPELFVNEDGMTLTGTTAGNYSMDIKFSSNTIDGFGTNKNKEDGEDLSIYGTEVGTREESVLSHIGAVLVTGQAGRPDDRLPDVVPVFPLPGALLLPRGQLPLNIFEPRYVNMVEDAFAAGRLLAMVQPRTETKHPIPDGVEVYDVACLGRIVSFTETGQGGFLINLLGQSRFRITGEREPLRGYRRMAADYTGYEGDLLPAAGSAEDRDRLMAAVRDYFVGREDELNWDALDRAPDDELVTTLAMATPLGTGEKQALLEAPDLMRRAALLTSLLEMAIHEPVIGASEGGEPDGQGPGSGTRH